jgi:hypothetical protein
MLIWLIIWKNSPMTDGVNPRRNHVESFTLHTSAKLLLMDQSPDGSFDKITLPASFLATNEARSQRPSRYPNQCARLIANAIIYYNSAILSRLLTKYEASGNAKALALIKKMSPAAWRHIHLNGHYTFHGDGQVIDLDAIVAGLELG